MNRKKSENHFCLFISHKMLTLLFSLKELDLPNHRPFLYGKRSYSHCPVCTIDGFACILCIFVSVHVMLVRLTAILMCNSS